jgi:hypothetical protein
MTDEPENHGPRHIGEVLSDLPTPTRQTPQARHHYTRAKQLEELIAIGLDPSPDMGFMSRFLALCSLPRTDPGSRHEYTRQNGPYQLIMSAVGKKRLPYGNLPRLLLAWVSTEAVRTQSRDLVLGSSLTSFMHQLGMYSNSGGKRGNRTRLYQQMDRLFSAHIDLLYEGEGHQKLIKADVTIRTELWWDHKKPDQHTLWQSNITLGESFYKEVIAHPIPLNMKILKRMKRSSLGLDLYMWLSYKTYSLYSTGKPPERLTWQRLYRQFAPDPERANNINAVNAFRTKTLRELAKLKKAWPELDYTTPKGCLEIRPCKPSIDPATTGPLKLPVQKPVTYSSYQR